MLSAPTRSQLELIAELGELFSESNITWWLFGGWAMDFHAGEVTRDHDDIELFVSADDADRVRSLMLFNGFEAPAPLHPAEGQPYLRSGVEVGVWYLTAGRAPTMRGRWSDWVLPAGSFVNQIRTVGVIEAPVVSLECLLEMKTGFARQRHGGPLRAKDLADIERIRAFIARPR